MKLLKGIYYNEAEDTILLVSKAAIPFILSCWMGKELSDIRECVETGKHDPLGAFTQHDIDMHEWTKVPDYLDGSQELRQAMKLIDSPPSSPLISEGFKNQAALVDELNESEDSYRCLGVSTGHLSSKDCEIFSENAQELSHGTDHYGYQMKKHNMLMQRDTGWFLKLYEGYRWELNATAPHLKGLSRSAMQLIEAAFLAGYRLIEFDCDASEYEWSDRSDGGQKTETQSFEPSTTLDDVFNALCPVPDLPNIGPAQHLIQEQLTMPIPELTETHYIAPISEGPIVFELLKDDLAPRVSPAHFANDVEKVMELQLSNYSGEFLVMSGKLGAMLYTLPNNASADECRALREKLVGDNPVFECPRHVSHFLWGRQNVHGARDFLKTVDVAGAKTLLRTHSKVAAAVWAKKLFDCTPSENNPNMSEIYSEIIKEYFPEGVPE
jgi:hypothetical protein